MLTCERVRILNTNFRSLFLGKIERLALASVNLETIVQESLYDPPRTPVEETLVTIWGEVLNQNWYPQQLFRSRWALTISG